MSGDVGVLLRALLADPSRVAALTPECQQRLVANLQAALGEDQVVLATTPATPAWSEGDLLTVAEAAALLRVSPRWLYRHARTLPFSRKLSRKVLRFSRSGIARLVTTKRL